MKIKLLIMLSFLGFSSFGLGKPLILPEFSEVKNLQSSHGEECVSDPWALPGEDWEKFIENEDEDEEGLNSQVCSWDPSESLSLQDKVKRTFCKARLPRLMALGLGVAVLGGGVALWWVRKKKPEEEKALDQRIKLAEENRLKLEQESLYSLQHRQQRKKNANNEYKILPEKQEGVENKDKKKKSVKFQIEEKQIEEKQIEEK